MRTVCLRTFFVQVKNVKFFKFNFRHNRIIFVPILFYVALLSLAKFLEVPLRSNDSEKSSNLLKLNGSNLARKINIKGQQNDGISAGTDKDGGPYFTLEEIFHKADSNNDGYLSTEEVSAWIDTKTQEHIHNAIMENYGMFAAIDVHPKNGLVSWKEYHSFFLHKQGLSKQYIMDHNERHKELSRDLKETIMRDRAAWSEAAKSDPDQLTLDEFLAFRHPESSHTNIVSLAEELLDKFEKCDNLSDRDGDEILTEDEFSSLDPTNENEKPHTQRQGELERRREFREVIDLNNDGKATRKELLFYIDPKNPRHAKEEAETLVVLADVDHDGRLSLLEVFNKMDLFLGSKMVDIATSFHDEF